MNPVRSSQILLAGLALIAACQFSRFETFFQAAERLFVAEDFSAAIEMYQKAIGENSRRPEAYYGLALTYYRMGYFEEAMFALEKTLELDPRNNYARERLAAVYLDLAFVDSTLRLCRSILAEDPEFVSAINTLGHAYFATGQISRAESTFTVAVGVCRTLNNQLFTSRDPAPFAEDEAEAFNALGEIYIGQGLYTHALELFDAAVSLTPYWDTPWFNKAIAYDALGNYSAAHVAYQRTIDIAPGNLPVYRSFARFLVRLKKESDAIDILRRALRVDSTDRFTYYSLAEIYERRGDYREASVIYDQLLLNVPDDPFGYLRAGKVQLKRKEYDTAIERFREAIDLQPDFAEAFNGLGEGYRFQGLIVQARDAFEKAVSLDSTLASALRNLGTILLEKGEVEKGVTFMRRAAVHGDLRAQEFLRARSIDWKH